MSRLDLALEIARADFLLERALPALEAAHGQGKLDELARVAKEAVPILAEMLRSEKARRSAVVGDAVASSDPAILALKRDQGRLEALLPRSPFIFLTKAALEDMGWALLRAAQAAPPVSLGTDWDLLRVVLDRGRRREDGLAAIPRTLAGKALMGEGPLATRSGFALARERSYATGWNSPATVRKIARALSRLDGRALEKRALSLEGSASLARGVYPPRLSTLPQRTERATAALAKLKGAYETAASLGAGVFVEVEVV
ncbi:hypothetical protein HY251_20900 [bacterium]|nr:hypothetical protein [bacterium]